MKKYSIAVLLLSVSCICFAQDVQRVAVLKRELATAKADTTRVLIMAQLCFAYNYSLNPDSSLHYGQASYELARKINFPSGAVIALGFQSFIQHHFGNLPKAMELALEALKMAKDNHAEQRSGAALNEMGMIYFTLKDYPKALDYLHRMESLGDNADVGYADLNIANIYVSLNKPDSAKYYLKRRDSVLGTDADKEAGVSSLYGDIELASGNYSAALVYYRKSLHDAVQNNELRSLSGIYNNISGLYQKKGQTDSALYYAAKGLATAQKFSQKDDILKAATLLAELYEPTDAGTSLHYYKIADATKDSMHSSENLRAIETIIHQQQEQQQTEMANVIAYRNRLKQYILVAGLVVILLIAGFLFRNNRNKQKANILLAKQKEQIQNALSELKSTQSQLIQSEKMASLGELTAGIAHEIQNPLNFVNNFSDINAELIEEANLEIAKGNVAEAKTILNDVKDNSEKINHHGKRADAIVKSMLQHSRTSSGKKEPTDINALADEYLRLSYHGMRAKDKSFNCSMETHFDESIEKINVVPQDIGRVLLNLFNNAFYACIERKNLKGLENLQGLSYVPTVTIITRKENNHITIAVTDNGNGIPEKIKDKIFQPFFTTKPTGLGTGLGLSLSFDIITKEHNGTIKVESTEGEGTEFIIQLPTV